MNISIELSQKQIVTQYMIQYMNLLQMNHSELENFLEKQSLENPVIEFEKNTCLYDRTYKNTPAPAISESDSEWTSNDWTDTRETEDRLSDYVLSQLTTETYSKQDASILRYLALSLDHRGYFLEDPTVAAQLNHLGIQDTVLETIIRNHLPALSRNHLDKIAAELNVPVSRVKEAADAIKKLNPKPGSYFSNRDYISYVIPDIYIKRNNFSLTIILPDYQNFHFSVSNYYQQLKNTTSNIRTHNYLQQKIQQAEWISDKLRQRTDTITRVVQKITDIQRDFFLLGPGYKRPMRLIDLAEALDMHPSTISRTLRGKYLHCEWGVYALNYFLTSAAAVDPDTSDEKTPEQIKKHIQRIINQENKSKPLSDQKICTLLEAYAIHISRRTVNKYRSEMNIPDKIGRKAWA